jgi:hypothetical protein
MKLVELETKEEYEALQKSFKALPSFSVLHHYLGTKLNGAGEWTWIENGSKVSDYLKIVDEDGVVKDGKEACVGAQYSPYNQKYYAVKCGDTVFRTVCEKEE